MAPKPRDRESSEGSAVEDELESVFHPMANLALHGDAWDDTALIQAYDDAIDSYRRKHGGGREVEGDRGQPRRPRADRVAEAGPRGASASGACAPCARASASGTPGTPNRTASAAATSAALGTHEVGANGAARSAGTDEARRARGEAGDANGLDDEQQRAELWSEYWRSQQAWHAYGAGVHLPATAAAGSPGHVAGTYAAQASWPPQPSPYAAWPSAPPSALHAPAAPPPWGGHTIASAYGSAQQPHAGMSAPAQAWWAHMPSPMPAWPQPAQPPHDAAAWAHCLLYTSPSPRD